MNKVLVIAEAGVNHNGDIRLAKKLVDLASDAGADYVKFQSFNSNDLLTKKADKASYQIKLTNSDQTQYEMLKELELQKEDHFTLIQHCKQKNIRFLSSAFDLKSIDFLSSLNLDFFKVPSGEITNYPYLERIGCLNKKVLLSTGMSNMEDINDALAALISSGTSKDNITIMHCNTEYPTPKTDANIMAMKTIKEKFGTKVGYSDHTLGFEAAIAAIALGSCVIEKHITLDKNMKGPDHQASMELDEFKQFVRYIRNTSIMLGSGIKAASKSELKNIGVARKSIVASSFIKMGEKFSDKNITTKRPGNGLSPMLWLDVLDKKASKDYDVDDQIELL